MNACMSIYLDMTGELEPGPELNTLRRGSHYGLDSGGAAVAVLRPHGEVGAAVLVATHAERRVGVNPVSVVGHLSEWEIEIENETKLN